MIAFLLLNWKWLAGAAVAVVLGVLLGITRIELANSRAEVASRLVAEAELRAAGQKLVADAEAHARLVEARYAAQNIQIEKGHADATERLDKLAADNRRYVAAIGLWDKTAKPGACSGNGVPGSPDPAGSGATPTAGIRFSDEASTFLLSLAADADAAAEYGRTCHAWAMSLRSP